MTDNIRNIHVGVASEIPRTGTRILGSSSQESISLDPRSLPVLETINSGKVPVTMILDDPSGRLGNAVASFAVAAGQKAVLLTASRRPLPQGVERVFFDRTEEDPLKRLPQDFLRKADGTPRFTLTVDCGAQNPAHARQDWELALPGTSLVFLSRDLVYDGPHREFPTVMKGADYDGQADSPWNALRKAEMEFLQMPLAEGPRWLILRPTALLLDEQSLDEFPPFQERIAALRNGGKLKLADGGHWLIQPLAFEDLAKIIFAFPEVPEASGAILDCAGPVILEFRHLCQLAACLLEKEPIFEECSSETFLTAHPEYAPYLCHRFYPPAWEFPRLPRPSCRPADALRRILL